MSYGCKLKKKILNNFTRKRFFYRKLHKRCVFNISIHHFYMHDITFILSHKSNRLRSLVLEFGCVSPAQLSRHKSCSLSPVCVATLLASRVFWMPLFSGVKGFLPAFFAPLWPFPHPSRARDPWSECLHIVGLDYCDANGSRRPSSHLSRVTGKRVFVSCTQHRRRTTVYRSHRENIKCKEFMLLW